MSTVLKAVLKHARAARATTARANMAAHEEEESWEALFTDVTPIEQDDGPVPVVKIDYSPAFIKVMGYFRRVLVDGEHSNRALTLSAGARARAHSCQPVWTPWSVRHR